MTAITFDTLKLAQRLRDKAKYTPEQAESTASVLSDTFAEWHELQELATKADLTLLQSDLKNAELRLDAKIAEGNIKIIMWMIGVSFAQIAMLLTVFKLH